MTTNRAGRWGGVLAVLVAAALAPGCGPGTGRQAVSGTVNYQGQPLAHGTISFSDAAGPQAGALITDGKYDIPAAQGLEPGTYTVRIVAPVPGGVLTPEEKAAGASPKAKNLLPEKYDARSELKAEVKAGTPNKFDFNLD